MGLCEGKVALVTGGSRGIGAAIAQRLASEGAVVVVAARSLDSSQSNFPGTLRETVAAIESQGGLAVAIQANLRDSSSRAELVARCEAEIGAIDILVNNAAGGPFRPFGKYSERDLRLTYEINVMAPIELCQLVVPGMRQRKKGWILNISSESAEHPVGPPFPSWLETSGVHLYASSKAALNRFSTGLAAELYSSGIAVNALAPAAAVLTAAVYASGADKFLTEPGMVEPVEAMAEAALALCSGDSAKLTGRVLYSLGLLEELGRPIRTLDGRALHSSGSVSV